MKPVHCGAVHLAIESASDGWRTAKPIQVRFGYRGQSARLTVAAGSTTDFASVPAVFRSLISKVGSHARAAIVHDGLYRGLGNRRVSSDSKFIGWMTRLETDRLFRAMMLQDGTPPWRATVMYWAVRVGGKKAWVN